MPLMNLIVIAIIALVAFLWGTRAKGRGLFSALIAFLCVVAAGAVAFAVWEPLAYGVALGVDNAMVRDLAWTASLLVPFIVTLLVLRFATDQVIRANLELDDATNFIGGLVFGAGSGLITAGVIVIALSFGRMGPNMLGYQPIDYDNGNLVASSRLWAPADMLTAKFYQRLSGGAFATRAPMARYLPDPHIHAAMQRMIYSVDQNGKRYTAESVITPDAFEVVGRYTVEDEFNNLLTDTDPQTGALRQKRQIVKRTDGDTVERGVIEGYVVRFNSAAFEKKGQVLLGPGQARLLTSRTPKGDVTAVHPFAMIAPPEAGATSLYRFRLDGPDLYIASLGGESIVTFAIEFIVPPGESGRRLFIKNVRVPVDRLETTRFAGVAERDAAIRDLSILGEGALAGAGLDGVDTSAEVVVEQVNRGAYSFLTTSDALPLRISLISDQAKSGGIELDEDNRIVGGSITMSSSDMRQGRAAAQSVKVQNFSRGDTRGPVQLTLSDKGSLTDAGRRLDELGLREPPVLIDQQGRRYNAVGFVYDDGNQLRIRFDPKNEITTTGVIPELSGAKRDQTLVIVYWPTRKVSIDRIISGDQSVFKLGGGGLEVY